MSQQQRSQILDIKTESPPVSEWNGTAKLFSFSFSILSSGSTNICPFGIVRHIHKLEFTILRVFVETTSIKLLFLATPSVTLSLHSLLWIIFIDRLFRNFSTHNWVAGRPSEAMTFSHTSTEQLIFEFHFRL